MTKELYNISAADCLKLYPQILANSNRNMQAGKLLAKNGLYGPAISLQITALEEMIKCLIVLMDGNGFQLRKTKGVHRFFKEHGIRHYTAFILLIVYLFGEDLTAKLELLIKAPQQLQYWLELSKDEKRIEQWAEKYFGNKMAQLKSELPFFIDMDRQRTSGFYCDHELDFHSPEMISKEKYEYANLRITKVIALAKGFISASESQSPVMKKHKTDLLRYFKDNNIYDRLSQVFANRTGELFGNIDIWLEYFKSSLMDSSTRAGNN
ncbi:MAG: AbiV family abortive infection protein [Bacteroidetes bacterium]|nr:AbiV family abortive infection protein [Bacteroidota bacterium]